MLPEAGVTMMSLVWENGMTRSIFLRVSLFVLVFVFLILDENAYAYLDLGTGSYILQLLIGALFGTMFTIKIFWRSFKNFFGQLFSRK